MHDMSNPETHGSVRAKTQRGQRLGRIATVTRRILVAEDDAQMLRLVVEALGRVGYQVVGARSGSDLLEQLTDWVLNPESGWAFDLVISDHRMPGFSGLEVLEGFRELSSAPPFIMITAFGGSEFANEAWRAGARAVLDKPFEMRELLDVVVSLIGPAVR